MLKSIGVFCLCLGTLPAFCQTAAKYEVATIMDVKPHQAKAKEASEAASYDVSVKVGVTIYVALYTPPTSLNPLKYAAGRNLLVLVGEKTITYNDILGRSFEVPILSQRPATETKKSN